MGFADLRHGLVQPPQSSLSTRRDGCKRLIDFVCDRGRKLAERRDPRDMGKLGPRLTPTLPVLYDRLLRSPSGGNIHHRSDKLQSATRVFDRMRYNADMFNGSV